MKHTIKYLVIFIICLFSFNGFYADNAQALEGLPPCIRSGWPSERSDLLPDPDLVRGTLANGFRYVLYPNNEPKDRVAVYLDINAGSLNERDNQRGVAHYLEHMLFNGTTHYKPGELVKYFQSIGMTFGGDTNAHTSFDETVYKLNLPKGTDAMLEEGIKIMADFAGGASLLEEEIESERGVILEEKRARDSASYRAFVEENRFQMRGTLMPERMVIGAESVIQKADRKLLKGYYDAWYRPENMVMVVVGNYQRQKVEELIHKYFDSLRPRGSYGECPDLGSVTHQGLETFYLYEPDLGRTEVSIGSIWNEPVKDDSFQVQVEKLHQYAGILIMNNRLERLLEVSDPGYTDSGYYSGDIIQRVGYSAIRARTEADKWKEALKSIDESLRQALKYGFLPEELSIIKKDLISSFEAAVKTRESRTSQSLAMSIIHNLNANRVFQSPEQELELYTDTINNLDIEEVNKIFRKGWSRQNRLVSVIGASKIDSDKPEGTIRDYYSGIQTKPIAQPEDIKEKKFPYLELPSDTQAPVEEVTLPMVDAERFKLANNVYVTLKTTKFEPQKTRILVDLGYGKFSEPKPGMSLVAESVVNDSGTGHLNRVELGDVLAGTTVNVDFNILEDTFRFQGYSVTEDAELLVQLIYTLIVDPALREEAYNRSLRQISQMYDNMEKDISGPLSGDVEKFFAGGDRRAGLPPRGSFDNISLQDIQYWILNAFKNSAIEVVVIGDFEIGEMKELLLPYLSNLPTRPDVNEVKGNRSFPKGSSLVLSVDTQIDKAAVIAAWPTTDILDIRTTRRLNLLAKVFEERVRTVIREKLGASYSPAVYNIPAKIYPGYGKFVARVITAPSLTSEVLEALKKIAIEICEKGISDEEFARIQRPQLTSLKDTVRTNEYWLYSVLSHSVSYPQQLLWSTTMQDDYKSIKPEELVELAKEYLQESSMATAIVQPEGKVEKQINQ